VLGAWLGGCALAPLPAGARAVHAFQVETYLGNRFSGYGSTREACDARRAAERALERSTAPERGPFQRTTVVSSCRAAGLAEGGYTWAVEAAEGWGVVMPSGALCDAMRESLAALEPAARLGSCRPVTLTPR